eukprot:CAMPEP_0114115408 /NCGR_PEP_ID=MMETSP0043_2-20121206/3956_1 /TAXON_ID=464988 /ORGANISM="Hemiselmis andersenii, Strain CCMP644" /LENGTH=279 /DNA_ID=CAMNT_0001207675 /DNA_START=187 /DNA_END=1025 /DNA_ORIENTATION=+
MMGGSASPCPSPPSDPGRPNLIRGHPTTREGLRSRSLSFAAPAALKILGYGDSLTAGWHDDGKSLTPYAPSLEAELKKLLGREDVMVRHRGHSGWTAHSMLGAKDEEGVGLRAIMQRANKMSLSRSSSYDDSNDAPAAGDSPPEGHALTAVVIIAGTNDLAQSFSPDEIADSVLGLHEIAHEAGVRSISVDIPESAAAKRFHEYDEMREQVNAKLLSSSLQHPMRTHLPCPVPYRFSGEEGGDLWEDDGLHMSGPGYEALGRGLAPMVADVLGAGGLSD